MNAILYHSLILFHEFDTRRFSIPNITGAPQ